MWKAAFRHKLAVECTRQREKLINSMSMEPISGLARVGHHLAQLSYKTVSGYDTQVEKMAVEDARYIMKRVAHGLCDVCDRNSTEEARLASMLAQLPFALC